MSKKTTKKATEVVETKKKTLEHASITPYHGEIVTIVADEGYMLRSRRTGKLHKAWKTRHTELWEVIKHPHAGDSVGED